KDKLQKNHQAFEPNFAIFEQNKQIDKDKENFRSSIKFTKVQRFRITGGLGNPYRVGLERW
ncbi:MAG: hypothetical protein AB1414_16490, partial [bacterium]